MKYWRWYVRLIILLLMGAGLFYACYIEPGWIEVTHHRVHVPEWQGRVARLAVLGDLHAGVNDEAYLKRVVARTMQEKPDAVLLLGDYVRYRHDTLPLRKLEEVLRPLTAVPCFAVLGNHDYWYGAYRLKKMFRHLGIQMMEGKKQDLNAGGATLTLAGLRCVFTYRCPGNIPSTETGKPYILMTHSPAGVKYAPSTCLITVAGHTHGGQVRLPFYGVIYMPDEMVDRKKSAGYHKQDGKPFYVSRGVGTSQLPIRFCCRPEILVLEVVGWKGMKAE